MKGGSEGRRLEFSTSVTLAGLSIMCDGVDPERRSQKQLCRPSPSCSRVLNPVLTDRKSYFYALS